MDTKELRELLAKATPGPWEREGNDVAAHGAANDPRCDYYICEDVNGTRVVGATHSRPQDNAKLIVAAVNALPTLLDRAEKAEAELAALRARIAGLATKCANAVDANFEYMADTLDDVSVSLLRLLPAEGDTTTDGGRDG